MAPLKPRRRAGTRKPAPAIGQVEAAPKPRKVRRKASPTPAMLDEAERLRREGQSWRVLAARLGYDHQTIRKALQRRGYTDDPDRATQVVCCPTCNRPWRGAA